MPRYDYRCTSEECSHVFEVTQSFHDEPVAFCSVCGSEATRLISKVAVHFKGSGFYVTDSRASNGAGNGANGSNGKSDNGSSESSSESKPASESKSESSSPAASKPAEASKAATG